MRARSCYLQTRKLVFIGRPLSLNCKLCLTFLVSALLTVTAAAADISGIILPVFDFTQPAGTNGWTPAHDISQIARVEEGLLIRISGSDPYIIGPPRNYPSGIPLWLNIRLRSDKGGMCQVFYSNAGFSEPQSVRFSVPQDQWHEARVRLPSLGASYRIRIDPPGDSGTCTIAWLKFEPRVVIAPPTWPVPALPQVGPADPRIKSGDLEILHGRDVPGQFQIRVAGNLMAVGNTNAMLGYMVGSTPKWMPLAPVTNGAFRIATSKSANSQTDVDSIKIECSIPDPDGATWRIEQSFSIHAPGIVRIVSTATVDQARDVFYLPMLTLLPGLGSFGTNKTQALFAGVEYLENEPSSSTADLNPPASNRQVPDTAKITFPLMAMAVQGRFLGLSWSPDRDGTFCAVFDSPDRIFKSTGHLMGLLFPGSDGNNREENSVVPYDPARLNPNQPLTIQAFVIGGVGDSVVPAIQQYVQLSGLPPIPPMGMTTNQFLALAANGWLHSTIRDGNRYRHATPGFNSAPAADAALYMDYIAACVTDHELVNELGDAARSALAEVAAADYNSAQIGHVRFPAPALIYGAVPQNIIKSTTHAQNLLSQFVADGTIFYKPPASGPDYSSTHWSKEANGFAATYINALLEEASFAGNPGLIDAALRHLRALDKFRNTVPRGAQTWEIPLHTPDILASAYLVRAYVRGFELTGDQSLLDQARYWAWTGVPFVYLTPPTDKPVGLYATIPVLGATAWIAPVWIGLPVQWCGLAYAHALHQLSAYDKQGPWEQIADGIAISAIQQTYPTNDTAYRGLLPDSFNLRQQSRNLPAINPATTLAPAIRALHLPTFYQFKPFRSFGLYVHAPGQLTDIEERPNSLRFTVTPWSQRPFYLLINGFGHTPTLQINGTATGLGPPHMFQASEGRLILRLEKRAVVELGYPALASLNIEWLRSTSLAKLSWPAKAADFALESTQTLESESWTRLTNPVIANMDRLVTTDAIVGPMRFYRLAR